MAWIGNHISDSLWKAKTKWEKLYPFGKFEDDKLNGDLYIPVLCWNSLGHILVSAAISLFLALPYWIAPFMITAAIIFKESKDKGTFIKKAIDLITWIAGSSLIVWGISCL